MFYSKDDPAFIDKAVRAVIITIIIVFDPLAILLLIAAQQSYRKVKGEPLFAAKIEEPLDNDREYDVKYPDEIYEIIPKERVAKFKKNGDIE